MWRGGMLRISTVGVSEMVNFAGFMKYGEKFEEKVQVVLSGVFVTKVEAGQTLKLVRSFVVLSRIL